MKYHILLFLLIISISRCASIDLLDHRPKYKDVVATLKPYIDYFDKLTIRNHLHIKNKITAGMTTLSKESSRARVVGVCYSGDGYREIEIDHDFFYNSSPLMREMLVLHEYGHCRCGRDHDYHGGKKYVDPSIRSLFIDMNGNYNLPDADGYFKDYCPVSIMAPVMPYESCLEKYYEYYKKEVFENCKVW